MKWILCLVVLGVLSGACAHTSTQTDDFMMPVANSSNVYLCALNSFLWAGDNLTLISNCYSYTDYDYNHAQLNLTRRDDKGCYFVPTIDEKQSARICVFAEEEPPRLHIRLKTLVEYGTEMLEEDLCRRESGKLTRDRYTGRYEVEKYWTFCDDSTIVKNL